jgi:hypothetical protein
MTNTKWTLNTGDQQDLPYPAARFNEKGCLPVLGADALTYDCEIVFSLAELVIK